MAISPFSTLDEFNNAAEGPTEGAIYTFAQSPAIIGIAIIVSALVFCWFIYTTFTINRNNTDEAGGPVHYSVVILAGLLSLAGGLYASQSQPQREARSQPTTAPQPKQTPLALFGLTGLSALPTYRQFRRAQRRSRLRRKWRIR
ncbi:hypothetical protein IQ241_24605 [Romeria aff. gracilis LEGE 07310]|uniref:Uncharacterized protein n=1 Tax=Vasconcelosia minhoensis LEGE 07310 TaxID=915328 RepID=A0A8J7ALZ8_9CYAN|nr:hypothetical protein [Romeria gracilis]MBE9080428.1 hypothetical protein [Romeria aff. gracilis LEGE 07310]